MRHKLECRKRWTLKDETVQLIRHAMHRSGKGMQYVMAETKQYRKKPLVELQRILKREDGLI